MAEAHRVTSTLSAPHNEVYQDFKHHCNGHRVETQLSVLELLRTHHPSFHVTCTWPSTCDLLGYAAAGHATAILDCDDSLDLVRFYNEPGPRLEKKPAVLKNLVRFGRWKYTWERSDYLIYELVINEPMRGPTKLFYVLSPLAAGVLKDGHLSTTDNLLLAVGAWSTELHEEVYVMDEGHWTKSHDLWKSVQGCTWDEVILDSDMKASLIEDVHGFFNNQQLYKKLSVPWKRGLILHGVPGNGKTISIKAFINELSARPDAIPSLYVKSFDACKGAKYAIRAIFSHARIMAPCLLIFEDLDSLVTDETRSYFLNEVDGLESNDGILMIGSTNNLDALDPAISKRPSRFDRKYHFHLPGEQERTSYCQFWRRKLADSDMVDFQEELCPIIAKLSEGFSFAYLKELFVWALLTIARGGSVEEPDETADPDNDTPAEDANASDSTSNNGLVVVEKEEIPSQASSAAQESAAAPAPASATTPSTEPAPAEKKKIVVPQVEIPAHLKDNLLLNIIRGQIRMLLEEMDNTKDAAGKKKEGPPGANRSRRAVLRAPWMFMSPKPSMPEECYRG
jgi:transitional endoplasmic reticulum ATPase